MSSSHFSIQAAIVPPHTDHEGMEADGKQEKEMRTTGTRGEA